MSRRILHMRLTDEDRANIDALVRLVNGGDDPAEHQFTTSEVVRLAVLEALERRQAAMPGRYPRRREAL